MFRDATRAVSLVAAAIATAEFDAASLEARAGEGWTTLTEQADTLVRDHRLPFKTAHAIAARLIAARQKDPGRPLAALVADASAELAGRPLVYTEAALAEILSPRHFVAVRKTFGGPAPEETTRAADASHAQLDADQTWWDAATNALIRAGSELAERSAML
jgi:argininosuccinate lyase